MNFILKNNRGEQFPLVDNEYFYLLDINGQTLANVSLSSVAIGGIDGDIVNNMQTQPRPLSLNLRVKSGVNVEDAKRAILSVVKIKQNHSIVWTQNERTVVIQGIVESVEMPRWENGVAMQINIHCEIPYWQDIEAIVHEINDALPLHYFTEYVDDMLFFPEEGVPFGEFNVLRTKNIFNAGDVSTGLDIEIVAHDTVTNPIIYNAHGEYFGVGHGTAEKKVVMQAGDVIYITTEKGNKSVYMNGESLYNKLKPLSTWLQLETGDNEFTINSDDELINNVSFSLSFKQKYI